MLNPSPRTRGRAAHPTSLEEVRPLDVADLALLDAPRETKPRVIEKLRERHHSLARILASGASNNQASLLTGYDPARVSVLRSDPAFSDLITHYQTLVDEKFVDQAVIWNGMTKDALLEIRDRLEDAPDEFSNDMLLKIATAGADRTGHGPSTTQNSNVNVVVGMADRMERARSRLADRRKEIDLTANDGDSDG